MLSRPKVLEASGQLHTVASSLWVKEPVVDIGWEPGWTTNHKETKLTCRAIIRQGHYTCVRGGFGHRYRLLLCCR